MPLPSPRLRLNHDSGEVGKNQSKIMSVSLADATAGYGSATFRSGVFANKQANNTVRESAIRRRAQEAYIEEHGLQQTFDAMSRALNNNSVQSAAEAEKLLLEMLLEERNCRNRATNSLKFNGKMVLSYPTYNSTITITKQGASQTEGTVVVRHNAPNGALNDTMQLNTDQMISLVAAISESFEPLFASSAPPAATEAGVVHIETDVSGQTTLRHPKAKSAINSIVNVLREIRMEQRQAVSFRPLF